MKNKRVSQFGSALTEFAIIFPFFLGLVGISFDLSMMLIQRSQIDFAANETLLQLSQGDPRQYDLIWPEQLTKVNINPENAELDSRQPVCFVFKDQNYNQAASSLNSYQELVLKVNFHTPCLMCDLFFGLADSLQNYSKTYHRPYSLFIDGITLDQAYGIPECN